MATNLRLNPELESALKVKAAESGRSQQDLIREAIRTYLEDELLHGMPTSGGPSIRRAVTPYLVMEHRLPLPPGVKSSLELLDREDRLS
jgi:hypothetical protein